jgi:hypothetical protein
MTKKERVCKKYGLLPPKIAESVSVSLVYGLCGSGGSIYNKDTSQNTLYSPLFELIMIYPASNTGWFKIFEATNTSATSIQDLLHITWLWLACYPQPQFIVFDNGGEFKREFKQMCMQDNYGIKANPTTSHNHQSTSKCNH